MRHSSMTPYSRFLRVEPGKLTKECSRIEESSCRMTKAVARISTVIGPQKKLFNGRPFDDGVPTTVGPKSML